MRYLILIVFFCSITSLQAQQGDFLPLRYNENYLYLKNDSTNWYSNMKFLPVKKNSNAYFSFGGDVRYQYFYYKNEAWGDVPQDNDGQVMTRYLAHVDYHMSDVFRVFFQLQSSMANGKDSGNSPVDENQLDLHQLFIDVNLPFHQSDKITLRIGRQEFLYGSQRLVSVREGPNNRQAFDAIKLITAGKNINTDMFFSYQVASKPNIFDDRSDKNVRFWGIYSVINSLPIFKNADVYYLGISKQDAAFGEISGEEIRHSVGTRIWNKSSKWEYDFEGVYQWGEFAATSISAWTLSANTAYSFSQVKSKPKLGLKTEIISGNGQNSKLNTFNALFPRGAYFGLAALIGPSNLFDVHPYLELTPAKNLNLSIDCDIFWRMSKYDGIYGPNVKTIYTGTAENAREIGQQVGLELVYSISKFLSVQTEITWFNTGDYLKQVSTGKDILMVGSTTQLKF